MFKNNKKGVIAYAEYVGGTEREEERGVRVRETRW